MSPDTERELLTYLGDRQKFILALGVVLTVSVVLSSASCEVGSLTFDRKTKTKGCLFNGKAHEIDSEWIEDCKICSCSESGMQCCSNIEAPVGYDKETCTSKFDKESCSYKVTKKDNPSESCEVTSKTK
ncbi:beta-microseminoprotein-like [Mixophyes fleayi]|uniref:beta-microseminoprotein-like n=1 Tax=Mixophyes fleayi TaxID=3061075 RepID=UPI003F4DA483